MALNLERYRAQLRAQDAARLPKHDSKAETCPCERCSAIRYSRQAVDKQAAWWREMAECEASLDAGDGLVASGLASANPVPAIADMMESDRASRDAGLVLAGALRTELPLPSRPMPVKNGRDHETARAFKAAAEQGKHIRVQGAVNSIKAARADERQARRQAAAARRKASGRR